MSRLVIIGLDCLTPQWALEQWHDDMPNLKALAQRGVGARLLSTVPPITVPAWTCMMTSHDPGELGIYGFRNRARYDYTSLDMANASVIRFPTIWGLLSRQRRKSLVMGVPQTYPPKPLNGILVSCFMTPSKDVTYTYPAGLKDVLDKVAGGEYIIDVKDFRTDDKTQLLEGVYQMTEARFTAFRRLLKTDSFDFAMVVEMGPDRLHHGFWRYCDPTHRLYEPGNPFAHVLHDYYVKLDDELGKVLDSLDGDTSVMVVSDHGAKAMEGGVCINEWLQREGYLALKEPPTARGRLTPEMVDWSKTRAWGEGGYYARLFMNVQGREPEGQVTPGEYERVRSDLIAGLEAFGDEQGTPIGTRVFRPQDVYRAVNGIPPDLIVYFGDLNWRSVGSVGVGACHLRENDTGPDDANHAPEGVFVWDRPVPARECYTLYDIAPTVLRFLGVDVPADMIGTSLL